LLGLLQTIANTAREGPTTQTEKIAVAPTCASVLQSVFAKRMCLTI